LAFALSFALHSLTFAGRIASLRVNSTLRFSVVDVSINQFSVFLSLHALRQGPFAPSGFHRLSSLLWAPPTPSPSNPQCYCLPLQALQLYPSLGWASQVPDCSFRARCPTLPRKVPLEAPVILPSRVLASFPVEDLGHFHLFSFRGFHTSVHFRCGSLFRIPEASTDQSPSRLLRLLHV
jgi:hypothetical protein